MRALFWHLGNRSAETEFIFGLFQSLLAGLGLLVLLRHLRPSGLSGVQARDWLLPFSLLLLASQSAVHALHFGLGFFFHKEFAWTSVERLTHGLRVLGFLVLVSACLETVRRRSVDLVWWTLGAGSVLAGVLAIDALFPSRAVGLGEDAHSLAMLVSDILVLPAAAVVLAAVVRGRGNDWQAYAVVLGCLALVLLLHIGSLFVPASYAVLRWSAEQHVLLTLLFALAWAIGERFRVLLDRVFVRLNLTFIVLASLILLATVGMEKYQYLHLAEERSLNLAEFLRGHVAYYRAQGETLEEVFHRPDLLRRVVVEFGTLPELRDVRVFLDGQRVSFHYAPDWEIEEQILPAKQESPVAQGADPRNSFRMISLPIEGAGASNHVELIGTMDYINADIGRYIILIYSLFTLVVGLATGVIGIIVTDAERQRRRQDVELQEAQRRLAQAAKLASIGQLAGGMAHAINTPMTSILALATHLTDAKSAANLTLDQRKSFDVIAKQAQRASKIVGDVLTFSGQRRLEVSRVDIGDLIDTAIGLLHHRLNDPRIQLHREIDDELPPVLGDPGRLTEVFVNVLNNAIDAMPSGGTLVVRTLANREPNRGIRVEVTDSGGGIPSEHLPRIFDPFFTTKQAGRGTGLGLSISHSVVMDHGGQIWAENVAGGGARLVVTLPTGGDVT